MDRALLLEHREQTLGRLAESEGQLARQEELIARLRRAMNASVED
jgi:hypothetical protein